MKNELINETSPYLLQHAHNPVHWQPWSEDALKAAVAADKPILVSIGYSACHWCHVMERESFENEETASIMNDYLVNIKIDREERPDLDHIYMDAVQAMIGSGGWPLNVFLTPEGKPFYGGTYFPPQKAFNRASWTDVLHNIHDAWINRREEMEKQAETLIDHIKNSNSFGRLKNIVMPEEGEAPFTKADCETITENFLSRADTKEGGFGAAPKFPQTFSINCLLQAAYFLDDRKSETHALLSLNKMIDGGIYDQIGGGLCRYSTDAEWLAPHFEKMLYDNALFITTLANAALLTKHEKYKETINHTCDFLFREMKNADGGYYAALDADSEGVEGKFYVWDKTETDEILGDDAETFNAYYDVTEEGNWEHHNILRVLQPLAKFATSHNISEKELREILNRSAAKLMNERSKRIRPGTDDKILLGWNALLVTAFCKAYAVTQDDKYLNEAVSLTEFLLREFDDGEGGLHHTYKNGTAKYPAFLDDYTYLVEGLIHLQEITADENYLHTAKKFTDYVFEHFRDTESEYFFFTRAQQQDIVVRKIELYDGATPSANGVMAKNLLYLSLVFDKSEWHQKGLTMIYSLKDIILKHPGSFGIWAAAAMNFAAGINEIAIIGNDMMLRLREVLLHYIPNKILLAAKTESNMPLLKEKGNFSKTSLYLCRNYSCENPVETTEELIKTLTRYMF